MRPCLQPSTPAHTPHPHAAPRPRRRSYLIEKGDVALVPGDAFGAPSCIRISYAASMETLGKALDRLAAALAPENFSRSSS